MLFTSPKFILFLTTVFILYYSSPFKLKNIVLLISSYIFYAFWNIQFVVFLIVITLITYFFSSLLVFTQKNNKFILILGLFCIFTLLISLKYYGVLYEFSNNFTLFSDYKWVLPIGISFYSFQSAAYLIDVYRNKNNFEKSLLLISLFIAFFPQLISGPISRAHKLIPQFKTNQQFNYPLAEAGIYQFIWGAFKKLVIADQLSTITFFVFNKFNILEGIPIWIGVLAYTIQIYADFSGYSDMAIGVAKILGFKFDINFKNPYFATSIKDFWSRWHISLSSWFKDYLYIPLGGNRVSYPRWVFNIILTFIISGIWHGANITFIYWGLIHGILQIMDNIFEITLKKWNMNLKIPQFIKTVSIFLLVSFAWIFFRADSFYNASEIIKKLFIIVVPTNIGWLSSMFFSVGFDKFKLAIVSFSLLILFIIELKQYKNYTVFYDVIINRKHISIFALFLILYILVFGVNNSTSFIYFNF